MPKTKKSVSIAPVVEVIEPVAPVKKVKKVRAKSTLPRKPNAWLAHVKAYREKHPDTAYKVCLQEAKKTYVKGGVLVQNAPNIEGGSVKSKKEKKTKVVKVVKKEVKKEMKSTKSKK
jgi:hypothetical protein